MKELAARISGAELDVLEVLWQAEGPMPIADVRGALEQVPQLGQLHSQDAPAPPV